MKNEINLNDLIFASSEEIFMCWNCMESIVGICSEHSVIAYYL